MKNTIHSKRCQRCFTTPCSQKGPCDKRNETKQEQEEVEELEKMLDLISCKLTATRLDLQETKASIVDELKLAGVTKVYDGGALNEHNYIQGIHILRDRAINPENSPHQP